MSEPRQHDVTPAFDGQCSTKVRIAYTADGNILLELLDDAGKTTFAHAEFTPHDFSILLGHGCEVLELVSKGGLAVTDPAGSA